MTAPAATGVPPGTRDIELTIGGMTCAACAARVEKKLNKLADVRASVNYATATATVTAPSGLPAQMLTAAVEQAGYTAAARQEQVPSDVDGRDTEAGRHFAYLKRRLIVAVVLFIPLTDVSLVLSLAPGTRFPGWQWLLVACGAPVALWCAWPFHRAALKNARHGSASMDTLVSLGIIAAGGWSVYAMFVLDPAEPGGTLWQHLTRASGGGIYLETAATVTTFLLAGRLYEARARRIAGQAMRDLEAAAAKDVCVIGPDGTERFVPMRLLRPGDSFRVLPGERIAADGEVLFGQSAVDRSMMTGESVPADVAVGDTVTGGTVALTGRLVVRADRVGRDTQLSHLIRLVEQAQAAKASVQRAADRVCGVFVPAVLCAAALTLAGWLLAGSSAAHAFSAGLAVLIIACPCALGLATPAALVAACGRGARLGIFIKGYQPLETSRSVKVVVLDKTGTVTTGQMTVTDVAAGDETTRAELLRYAGAVEQASEHAVAAAVSAAAKAECWPLPQADGFRALPGLGARGTVDGHEVIIGREKLFADRGMPVPDALSRQCLSWERDGRTTVLIGWDGAVRGAVAVADAVKPSARAAVTRLRTLGLHPVLLTGDNEATARTVAAAVGIEEVIAGTMPDGKAAVIAAIQASGRPVAMVGDGVNDAPALATADLGLALGSGTDVAICAADLILLSDDLGAVPDAIRLARATFRTIRVNLAWAFGYNVAVIPLAALGFLNPVLASAAMTLSSVFVVSNSLQLQRLRVRPGEQHRHPDPGRRGDQGGAPQPLRRPGDSRRRHRRRGEGPRGIRRDSPARPVLNFLRTRTREHERKALDVNDDLCRDGNVVRALCLIPRRGDRRAHGTGSGGSVGLSFFCASSEHARRFPMSEVADAAGRTTWRGRLGTEAQPAGMSGDPRQVLQLVLAAVWLLDAVLQFQSFMYTKAFTQMLAATASGNPPVIARPITWDATLIEHHLAAINTIFAVIQLLIGLGIAYRPTARYALALSVAWALGVWWFGEGLGGVLSGAASPLNGAPGAVVIYALLAVLLWPADRDVPAPFTAARAVGAHAARGLWLVLWFSLAYFSLTPANRAPQAASGMISGMESGNPGWLATLDRGAASLVSGQGLAASVVLAAALVLIAAGVYLPVSAARATLVLAITVALVIWVFGEAFGMIMAGGATDPNSGPLLVLLALSYWPLKAAEGKAA